MIGALIGDAGDNSGSTSYYSLPETGATEQLDSDAQSLPSVQHSQPEFPVNSFVTPEQYARPDIGHKYRLGAEQHITFHRQSPHSSSLIFSSKQPSSKPYSCPCSNQGCMLQFSTKAEALASHRQHESGKQLQQIQFLTPYWTGNSPQEIAFKPDGPIVSTRQGRRTEPDTTTSWPKALRYGTKCKRFPQIEAMHRILEDPETRSRSDALFSEAQTWAGKQAQGTVHMFSKFDPQHYEACGFNPQFIRHYPCPVNGCKHTGRTPAAISQHIRSASEACKLPYAQEHATYLGKLFQFYRIVLRTNDEPDYLLDSYQGPSAAHKNKHQKTEQPLISHQKRSKKLDEPAAKRSKTAGSDRDYPIDLLKGFTETLGAASQKQLAAAKEVYDIRSQTKDKMHKQTVAHQEQMHESQRTNAKQEARRREQVHELQLANAKQEAEKKVLQAQLAAAELYKTTVLPLVTRLAAQGDAEVLLMAEHAQTQHAQTQHAPTQPHQPVQFTA